MASLGGKIATDTIRLKFDWSHQTHVTHNEFLRILSHREALLTNVSVVVMERSVR